MNKIAAAFLMAAMLTSMAAEWPTMPDNGRGTAFLPPAGSAYQSTNEPFFIREGLPTNSTIRLVPILTNFLCLGSATNFGAGECFVTDDHNPTNGETLTFLATLRFKVQGTGALTNLQRELVVPNVGCAITNQPRACGQATQSFNSALQQVQGQLAPGDSEFDLLRITGGTLFGMASSGQTTLTRQQSGRWGVESYFDMQYRIDFVGHPGGNVGGMSGSTTGTIRLTLATPPEPVVTIQPAATGQLELGWGTASNMTYQPQFCTAIGGIWTNLGGSVSGDGVRATVTNAMNPGPGQQFYRVLGEMK